MSAEVAVHLTKHYSVSRFTQAQHVHLFVIIINSLTLIVVVVVITICCCRNGNLWK